MVDILVEVIIVVEIFVMRVGIEVTVIFGFGVVAFLNSMIIVVGGHCSFEVQWWFECYAVSDIFFVFCLQF